MSNDFDNVFEDLLWREAIAEETPGAREILAREKVTCYNGFDPTAPSLHIGNLVPIMGLVRMQQYGHTPIVIVGGGTGMIGDPGGRSDERQLLSVEQIDENVAGIQRQLESFLDFSPALSNRARIINNADWLRTVPLIDFLRDVGKHFTVSTMLSRESVKSRMDRDSGISFTEFSYQLIQAYDFLRLFEEYNCTFQMGGSDQWGNILGGVDLIRRVHGGAVSPSGNAPSNMQAAELPAHALAYPLITTASGEKFGKSIGGAPTLDPDQTSPGDLFRFILDVPELDVVKFLKLFTLLGKREIEDLEDAVKSGTTIRKAQEVLATQVTKVVHGESGLLHAKQSIYGIRQNRDYFRMVLDDPNFVVTKRAFEIKAELSGITPLKIPRYKFVDGTISAAALAQETGAAPSRGAARQLIADEALIINGKYVEDPNRQITEADLIDNEILVLQRGKRKLNTYLVIVSE